MFFPFDGSYFKIITVSAKFAARIQKMQAHKFYRVESYEAMETSSFSQSRSVSRILSLHNYQLLILTDFNYGGDDH
jgi:hypothetical protein